MPLNGPHASFIQRCSHHFLVQFQKFNLPLNYERYTHCLIKVLGIYLQRAFHTEFREMNVKLSLIQQNM